MPVSLQTADQKASGTRCPWLYSLIPAFYAQGPPSNVTLGCHLLTDSLKREDKYENHSQRI